MIYPSADTMTPDPRLCSFHFFGVLNSLKGLKKSKKGSSKKGDASLRTTFVVEIFTTAGDTAPATSEKALLVSMICLGTFGAVKGTYPFRPPAYSPSR